MEVQGNDLQNYVKSIYCLEKSVLVQQNAIRALEGYVSSERKNWPRPTFQTTTAKVDLPAIYLEASSQPYCLAQHLPQELSHWPS